MRYKLHGVGPKVVTEKRVRFLARGWHIESKRGVRHIAVRSRRVISEKRVRLLANGWHVESKRGIHHTAVEKPAASLWETGNFFRKRKRDRNGTLGLTSTETMYGLL